MLCLRAQFSRPRLPLPTPGPIQLARTSQLGHLGQTVITSAASPPTRLSPRLISAPQFQTIFSTASQYPLPLMFGESSTLSLAAASSIDSALPKPLRPLSPPCPSHPSVAPANGERGAIVVWKCVPFSFPPPPPPPSPIDASRTRTVPAAAIAAALVDAALAFPPPRHSLIPVPRRYIILVLILLRSKAPSSLVVLPRRRASGGQNITHFVCASGCPSDPAIPGGDEERRMVPGGDYSCLTSRDDSFSFAQYISSPKSTRSGSRRGHARARRQQTYVWGYVRERKWHAYPSAQPSVAAQCGSPMGAIGRVKGASLVDRGMGNAAGGGKRHPGISVYVLGA
ncbi:hypothetical protein DFH09DRAFT_1427988 [Mycena vulgaris]|nr:hypothetical protein DFH09DRAFT_1427988 [Mycena vulgaris]